MCFYRFADNCPGRYSCIGKQIGLAEMRLVTAALVKKYRFGFDDPNRRETFLGDTQDCFTAKNGDFVLRFDFRSENEAKSSLR